MDIPTTSHDRWGIQCMGNGVGQCKRPTTMPAFFNGGKSSIVDLTFVDSRLIEEGFDWRVSNRYTGSDHQALI